MFRKRKGGSPVPTDFGSVVSGGTGFGEPDSGTSIIVEGDIPEKKHAFRPVRSSFEQPFPGLLTWFLFQSAVVCFGCLAAAVCSVFFFLSGERLFFGTYPLAVTGPLAVVGLSAGAAVWAVLRRSRRGLLFSYFHLALLLLCCCVLALYTLQQAVTPRAREEIIRPLLAGLVICLAWRAYLGSSEVRGIFVPEYAPGETPEETPAGIRLVTVWCWVYLVFYGGGSIGMLVDLARQGLLLPVFSGSAMFAGQFAVSLFAPACVLYAVSSRGGQYPLFFASLAFLCGMAWFGAVSLLYAPNAYTLPPQVYILLGVRLVLSTACLLYAITSRRCKTWFA